METFFTKSEKIEQVIKSFNLTKTLFVSSIIIGEAHTGKKLLAKYLFPNATLVSGKNQDEVEKALEQYDEIIIADFEKLTNPSSLNFSNKRVVATANYLGNPEMIDDIFAFIYYIPPLSQRQSDVNYLCGIFLKEAQSTLMLENLSISAEEIPLDLTANSKSLKRSIYYHLTKQTMSAEKISEMLYNYLYTNFEGNDNYRRHLGLYEKPLIEAGLKRYGSQLQLAAALGINRNTLRKKIHEHNID